jgi:hypothetical protein
MPNRVLREGILTSERIALLAWPAEVFYRRLMSVVDDFGRYHAHPSLLRAACYPLHLEKVREADISRWLAECEKAGLIVLYDDRSSRYLEMCDFRQQVRAKASKFPQPPPDARQPLLTCVADAQQMLADAHVVGDGVEGEGGARKRAKRPLPEDFGLSAQVIDWAQREGFGHLQEHLDHFRLKAAAHDYRYVDWDSAFMGAIRDDWAKLNARPKDADKFAGVM